MKIALLSLSLLFVTAQSFALAVKADKEAAKGCMGMVSMDDAKAVMTEFNIKTSGATSDEVRTLGTGLTWIKKLNDGRVPLEAVSKNKDGFTFKFINGTGNSHEAGWGVEIRRNGKKNYGENVAQLVHELGHLIGNQGGYTQYRNYVGGKYCKVSGYSDDRANEQFAEVFAAFVTKPELISKNPSSTCALTYKFFSRVFFSNGELAKSCN